MSKKARQLTDRDKAILTDLVRCRVLSFSQIKSAYWPTAEVRTCQDRLEKLRKAEYIKETTIRAERPGRWMKVYFLDLKGKKWATGPEGGFDKKAVFTHPGKFGEILHQIRTNEIYYRLTEKERSTWKIGDVIEAERGVYKGGGGIETPDASYISDGGDEIYVETDVGCYTSRQVKEKADSFGDKKNIWVCPENRRGFLIKHGARGEFFTYSYLLNL